MHADDSVGVPTDAGGLRAWRALAGAVALVAFTGVIVALATSADPAPRWGATTDARPLPELVAPVLAAAVETQPERVTATDWLTLTYPEPEIPPVAKKPRSESRTGSSGGAWYVVCGPGSAALEPAPPCGFDENGQPIVGERVWIDG